MMTSTYSKSTNFLVFNPLLEKFHEMTLYVKNMSDYKWLQVTASD